MQNNLFFLKIFLMWTIFKVFIEFVKISLLFYVLFFWLRGMWDLSSPTWDWTCTPCTGRWSFNHWTAREVPKIILFIYFYKFIYLIYLFLAALGLRCCTRAFSSCSEWGLLFVTVCGLLTAVASLLRSTGSRQAGFSSCSMRAQQLWLTGSRVWAQ